MRILLDENLPHHMRLELPGHEVTTAAFMGWSGIDNGALLRRAAEAGFDAMLTNDRGMEHEQNRTTLPIAVIVLLAPSNTLGALRPLYPELLRALNQIPPCGFMVIGTR